MQGQTMDEWLILRDVSGQWRREIACSAFSPSLAALRASARARPTGMPSVQQARLTQSALVDLACDPGVLAIAPVMPTRLVAPEPMDDIRANDIVPSWGLDAVGAKRTAYTGKGTRLAVLDTGIDAKHPTFNGLRLTLRDFVGHGFHDDHGHGTHCAATIFGQPIDGVRVGVAQGLDTPLVGKILADYGRGTSVMLIEGLIWALSEAAHVIMVSADFDPGAMARGLRDKDYPAGLAQIIANDAHRSNIALLASVLHIVTDRSERPLVVVPAGNDSRRTISPQFIAPTRTQGWGLNVMPVGAVGAHDGALAIAPFSNLGPALVAPGVGILSAAADGGTRALNGTTMAAAHVAGAAALWREAAGPRAFAQRLLSNCNHVATLPANARLAIGAGLLTLP